VKHKGEALDVCALSKFPECIVDDGRKRKVLVRFLKAVPSAGEVEPEDIIMVTKQPLLADVRVLFVRGFRPFLFPKAAGLINTEAWICGVFVDVELKVCLLIPELSEFFAEL